eukprot:gene10827-16913_t
MLCYKGATGEAEALFRSIATFRQAELKADADCSAASSVPAANDDGDDDGDDWENCDDDDLTSKLATVKPAAPPAPEPKPRAAKTPAAKATPVKASPAKVLTPKASTPEAPSSSSNGAQDDVEDAQQKIPASGPQDHVLEMYGLTLAVKTQHLEEFADLMCQVLEDANDSGSGRLVRPSVKWVDDYHALLVCPNVSTATALLKIDQHEFNLRPWSEASEAAKLSTDIVQPFRCRTQPQQSEASAAAKLSTDIVQPFRCRTQPQQSEASAAAKLSTDIVQPFRCRTQPQQSEASAAAKLSTDIELLPPRVRPATTAAVARRLLSHALGLPGLRDKAAEQKLAAKRKEAKDVRLKRHQAVDEVWGDE